MRRAAPAAILGTFALLVATTALADGPPSLFGRLFRRGASTSAAPRRVAPANARDPRSAELLRPPADFDRPTPPGGQPAAVPPASLVPAPANGDPLVTRLAVGRATDGSTFGLFLQVYADGTVMDSAGLHHADPARLGAVRDALAALPLDGLDHHYPGPAAGDLEVIQLIVYRRSKGKIQAVPVSYSGEPSGAPEEVRRLNEALEDFEIHLAGGPVDAPTTAPAPRSTAPQRTVPPDDIAPPPPLVAPR